MLGGWLPTLRRNKTASKTMLMITTPSRFHGVNPRTFPCPSWPWLLYSAAAVGALSGVSAVAWTTWRWLHTSSRRHFTTVQRSVKPPRQAINAAIFLENKASLLSIPQIQLETGVRFSVAQFNILARNLALSTHFPYVLKDVLAWKFRKNVLIQQLADMDADIVCLEELSDYWTFFRPTLEAMGYESVYVKRPSLNASTWSGERKLDGCGIFFKKSVFALKECESVNYNDEHDRVALLTLLEHKKSKQWLLVGNTHIWWNSVKIEDQLKEVYQLEEEIKHMMTFAQEKYVEEFADFNANQLPIVLCGDFNNDPNSSIYSYMTKKFLRGKHSNVKIPLRSAYDQYLLLKDNLAVDPGPEAEPPHTTVNFRRCWTIDYIWYSCSTLCVKKLLKIPSEEELRSEEGPTDWFTIIMADDQRRLPLGLNGNHNGIPNSKQGSDHVPIMAEFELLPTPPLSSSSNQQLLQ